tara:strand:- start:6147 stop:6638 length:492 start_codon:yes stop_codon:yes gene_type:complete
MEIDCPICKKIFEVDISLIPENGRLLQCGSCNHKWFYKRKTIQNETLTKQPIPEIKFPPKDDLPKETENIIKQAEKQVQIAIDETRSQSNKSSKNNEKNVKDYNLIKKIPSYIVVLTISFVAMIVLMDTFKSPLTEIFPKLDFFLISLYETLKDIELFIIDLI